MTEIELEMENDTELRIECEQIYIMDGNVYVPVV